MSGIVDQLSVVAYRHCMATVIARAWRRWRSRPYGANRKVSYSAILVYVLGVCRYFASTQGLGGRHLQSVELRFRPSSGAARRCLSVVLASMAECHQTTRSNSLDMHCFEFIHSMPHGGPSYWVFRPPKTIPTYSSTFHLGICIVSEINSVGDPRWSDIPDSRRRDILPPETPRK